MEQKIITSKDNYIELDRWIRENNCRRILLVGGAFIRHMDSLREHLEDLRKSGVELVSFHDYQPNPLYENVTDGVKLFRAEGCDSIIAIGGGSAIDVAKCIKLYAGLPGDGADGAWLNMEAMANDISFLTMPTTAGTGSEATRYAVIYYKDAKQSILSDSFIPDTVLMDPDALRTLPIYQKKATMMDAFCHAIESFWSVNSTEESREYSRQAIELVLANMDGYLANTQEGNAGMLLAANLGGKAINISQTTAGHAMCYKITSFFHIAHGHSTTLCDRVLFPWMIENTDKCIDPRGEEFLKDIFRQIADAMGCENAKAAADKFNAIFEFLEFEVPAATTEQFEILKNSVIPVRLKNHPVALDTETIDMLYLRILKSVENVDEKAGL